MKYRRYAEYLSSSISHEHDSPWLFGLPVGWMRQPIKFNTYMKGRLGWQNLRLQTNTQKMGPCWYPASISTTIGWEECNHASQERYEIAPEIQLRPHDVLFMKDGAAMGKLAYVDELPAPACINSHLLLMRPQYSSYVPRFLFYVLKSHMFQAYMITRRTGTTFFGSRRRVWASSH